MEPNQEWHDMYRKLKSSPIIEDVAIEEIRRWIAILPNSPMQEQKSAEYQQKWIYRLQAELQRRDAAKLAKEETEQRERHHLAQTAALELQIIETRNSQVQTIRWAKWAAGLAALGVAVMLGQCAQSFYGFRSQPGNTAQALPAKMPPPQISTTPLPNSKTTP